MQHVVTFLLFLSSIYECHSNFRTGMLLNDVKLVGDPLWTFQSKLDSGSTTETFAASLGQSETQIVAGSVSSTSLSNVIGFFIHNLLISQSQTPISRSGHVYIYSNDSSYNGWSLVQTLSDQTSGSMFGYALSLQNLELAVGAYSTSELSVDTQIDHFT